MPSCTNATTEDCRAAVRAAAATGPRPTPPTPAPPLARAAAATDMNAATPRFSGRMSARAGVSEYLATTEHRACYDRATCCAVPSRFTTHKCTSTHQVPHTRTCTQGQAHTTHLPREHSTTWSLECTSSTGAFVFVFVLVPAPRASRSVRVTEKVCTTCDAVGSDRTRRSARCNKDNAALAALTETTVTPVAVVTPDVRWTLTSDTPTRFKPSKLLLSCTMTELNATEYLRSAAQHSTAQHDKARQRQDNGKTTAKSMSIT